MPAQVIQIDLAQPLPTLRIHRRGELWLLIKLGLQPIGWVRLRSTRFGRTIAPTILSQLIADTLPLQILDAARRRAFEFPQDDQQTSFSIVIPTQENAAALEQTLKSLALLQFPRFEIIIVDHKPRTKATADVCRRFPGVHRVIEPRPGIAHARNTGWQVARNPIVVYINDNLTIDPHFLTALAADFANEQIDCVAAASLPTTLNPAAAHKSACGVTNQILTARHFKPATWNAKKYLDLATAAATNVFAVRRNALENTNGFDPALKHAQPLDIFTRILRDGGQITIDPRGIAFEQSRITLATLNQRAFTFGYALAECCNKYFDDPELANVAALALRRWIGSELRAAVRFDFAGLLHIAGAMCATRAYRRSLRRVRGQTQRFVESGIVNPSLARRAA